MKKIEHFFLSSRVELKSATRTSLRQFSNNPRNSHLIFSGAILTSGVESRCCCCCETVERSRVVGAKIRSRQLLHNIRIVSPPKIPSPFFRSLIFCSFHRSTSGADQYFRRDPLKIESRLCTDAFQKNEAPTNPFVRFHSDPLEHVRKSRFHLGVSGPYSEQYLRL